MTELGSVDSPTQAKGGLEWASRRMNENSRIVRTAREIKIPTLPQQAREGWGNQRCSRRKVPFDFADHHSRGNLLRSE
jgi:hypothetical protein